MGPSPSKCDQLSGMMGVIVEHLEVNNLANPGKEVYALIICSLEFSIVWHIYIRLPLFLVVVFIMQSLKS